MVSVTARERAIGSLEERELFTLYRRRHRLTQEAVGRVAGVRQGQVSWWELGKIELEDSVVESLWTAAEELVAHGREGVAA